MVVDMIEALSRAQLALNSCLDLDAVLGEILRTVREVFDLEACAVLLLDGDESTMRIKAAVGYDPAVVDLWRGRKGSGITGEVAHDGKPVLVRNVAGDPRYVRGVPGAVCEMAAPLAFGDEVFGVLDAESTRDRTEEELRWFAVFAAQAALAFRNAGLLERERRRSRDLRKVSEVGALLNRSRKLDEVLDFILNSGRETLGYDRCALLLAADGDLVVEASLGYDESVGRGMRIPAGQGVTGEAATGRRPVLVRDVRTDPRYIAGSGDALSEMAVPLVDNGDFMGVLDAESSARHFDDDDLVVFAAFAEHATSALRGSRLLDDLSDKNAALADQLADISRINAELKDTGERLAEVNDSLEKRLQELSTLYEAGKAITSSLDLEETLRSILSMTERILDISTGAIVLLDEETSEMKVRVRLDRGARAGEQPSAATATGEVAPGRSPATGDIDIPLLIGDRLIGRFELSNRAAVHFTKDERSMLQTLASQAAIAIENARLYENTQKAYYEAIRSLAQALEARDAYTRGHSERVTDYALELAAALGLTAREQEIIRYAGLLHDIGKIGVADAVLLKAGALSADDFAIIKDHPRFGDAILSPIRFLADAQSIVKHHHEKWDGSGYPDHLVGEAIPLASRIIAVADSYDAMTSDRPYRKALPASVALAEIRAGAGRQYDPRLAEAFVKMRGG